MLVTVRSPPISLGQMFDHGEAEAGAAIAARDVGARLRERAKQPLDLGGRQPDAAVADGENEFRASARAARAARASSRTAPCSVNFTALSIRFSSAARSRTASPTSISGRSCAIVTSASRPFVCARAVSELRQSLDQTRGRNGSCCSVSEPASAFGGIDHQRRQRREMLRAGLDARRPAPLAFAEIRTCQQFAERENAGQRSADVVGERRERDVARAAHRPLRRRVRRAPAARRTSSSFFCLDLIRAMALPPRRRVQHATSIAGTKQARRAAGEYPALKPHHSPDIRRAGAARRAIRASSSPAWLSTACGHRHRE